MGITALLHASIEIRNAVTSGHLGCSDETSRISLHDWTVFNIGVQIDLLRIDPQNRSAY